MPSRLGVPDALKTDEDALVCPQLRTGEGPGKVLGHGPRAVRETAILIRKVLGLRAEGRPCLAREPGR